MFCPEDGGPHLIKPRFFGSRGDFEGFGELDGFWDAYRRATESIVARGNLVPDAHLAALLLQNGVTTLWTHDRDFRRFEGLRVRDPFAEAEAP